jgi:hypothetical protein
LVQKVRSDTELELNSVKRSLQGISMDENDKLQSGPDQRTEDINLLNKGTQSIAPAVPPLRCTLALPTSCTAIGSA